jgi:hypothetical protein
MTSPLKIVVAAYKANDRCARYRAASKEAAPAAEEAAPAAEEAAEKHAAGVDRAQSSLEWYEATLVPILAGAFRK